MRYLLKHIFVITAVVILSSCSMEKIANKIVPEHLITNAQLRVDAVMAKEADFFVDMQEEDMSDADFVTALDNMFSHVSEGKEIRRDIVGSSFKTKSSLGKGTTKTYSLVYEVQTDIGFTLISLTYFQSAQDTECCLLDSIYVQNYDSSPQRVLMENVVNILMVIGIVALVGIILLIYFLVRRRKLKARKIT